MKTFLQKIFLIKSTLVLLISSIFCVSLSLLRIALAENDFLLFLIWNLFLAFVPWLISAVLFLQKSISKFYFSMLFLLWLLFFPNALYIVTDLIHLKIGRPSMRWYDLVLILSYSFTGLFYAFVSLDFIETKFHTIFYIKHPMIISIFIIYLSSFGIYLGRFLRWNSWDVVTNLSALINDLILPLKSPSAYSKIWLFIFLLGTMFNLMYLSYKSFQHSRNKNV